MYSHVIFIFPLVCASLSGFVITTAIPQTNINSRHMTLEDYDTTTSLCVFLYARAKEMWFINPRRACERGLQYFVCLSVCMSVTTSLAHLAAKSLKFGHRQASNRTRMFKLSQFCQERFVQELCCDSFAMASTSWPYSCLRMSSCALVWDPGSTESAVEHSRRLRAAPVVSLGIQMRQQLCSQR